MRRRCRRWGFGWSRTRSLRSAREEQKDYFLPRILTGEVFFCQGYSEPEAGSDLAALSMAAVEDGDDLVCTGSKIWTTHAARSELDVRAGAHVTDAEEAAGHHVRADRHDVPRYRRSGRW